MLKCIELIDFKMFSTEKLLKRIEQFQRKMK